MGSLTFDKLIIIGIIVMLIFGPDKLPGLAEQLAHLIRRVKSWSNEMKDRAEDELGEDFSIDDWRKLDPRQYDPRRIVRDAWNEVDAPAPSGARSSAAAAAVGAAAASEAGNVGSSSRPSWAALTAAVPGERYVPGAAPFDDEAT
ncbi:twin-arginine translocase TatA/TatE family subunit [Gulosibacter hominis]|uniref:twin-arginine translocase TatA/TatE family subunit n=1 Tax=Gulosibacter hominis TaxID=2770504 RepID=UPI001E60B042|nr:twin-arginine translocase TatA/TatE family subunit [Gulosibacter hominis]